MMTNRSGFILVFLVAVGLCACTAGNVEAQTETTRSIPVTLVLVDTHEYGDASAVVLRRGRAGRHTVLLRRDAADARLITEAFLMIQMEEAIPPSERSNHAVLRVEGNMGLRPTGGAQAAMAALLDAPPEQVPQIGTYPSVQITVRQRVRPPSSR